MKKPAKNLHVCRAILAVLGTVGVCATSPEALGVSPVSRGRQVLLNRGLQLQTLVFFDQPGVANIDINRWKSANFTDRKSDV